VSRGVPTAVADAGIDRLSIACGGAMRESFPEFYSPTVEDFSRLWREALIVVDTNVLLNLYRTPATATEEFFSLLEQLKDQLWIPHQVALEFQRNRLSVIAAERKVTESILDYANETVAELSAKVEGLQLEKRGLSIDPKPILAELADVNRKLVEAMEAARKAQLEVTASDPIRDRLDRLFGERVGNGPNTQQELDDLIKDGEERYSKRMPPGFMDASKEKNPNEANYVFNGIVYSKKFGDLILWKQLIQHLKVSGSSSLIVVTSDNKDDWWWREHGKTMGPHPELVRELHTHTPVRLAWMYATTQFAQHAKEYVGANVSEQSVNELAKVVSEAEQVAANDEARNTWWPVPRRHDDLRVEADEAVHRWLSLREWDVARGERFPDFVVKTGRGRIGYEVKLFRSTKNVPSVTVDILLKASTEVRSGRFTRFYLVIVLDPSDGLDPYRGANVIKDRIHELLTSFTSIGIILGHVVEGVFSPIVTLDLPRDARPDEFS